MPVPACSPTCGYVWGYDSRCGPASARWQPGWRASRQTTCFCEIRQTFGSEPRRGACPWANPGWWLRKGKHTVLLHRAHEVLMEVRSSELGLVRWEATWEAFGAPSDGRATFGSRTQGWSWHELNQSPSGVSRRTGARGERWRISRKLKVRHATGFARERVSMGCTGMHRSRPGGGISRMRGELPR